MEFSQDRCIKPLLGLIILCTVFIYSPSFSGPFVADDIDQIVENEKIKNPKGLEDILFNGHRQKRILQNLTLALNWKISPGKTYAFKLTNLFLHLICGLLLFKWLSLNFKTWHIPLMSTALFLLHPLQVESVGYVMGRTILLQTTLFLSAFILLHLRKKIDWWFSLPIIFLAYCTKETSVFLPILLVVYQLTILRQPMSYLKSREAIVLLCLPVLYLPFMLFLSEPLSMYKNTVGFSIYPPLQYIVGQLYFYFFYAQLIFSPWLQSIFHPLPELNTETVVGAILGSGLIVMTFYIVIRYFKTKPIVSFLFILSFLSLFLTNGPLQMINPFAEYRLYISNIALFLFIAVIFKWLIQRWPRAGGTIVLLLIVGLSTTTYFYNKVWGTDYQIYSRAAKLYPSDFQTQYLVGTSYELTKDFENAEKYYLKAVELSKKASRQTAKPIFRLAATQYVQGKLQASLDTLNEIPLTALSSGIPLSYYSLRLALTKGLQLEEDYSKTLKEATSKYGTGPFQSYIKADNED